MIHLPIVLDIRIDCFSRSFSACFISPKSNLFTLTAIQINYKENVQTNNEP